MLVDAVIPAVAVAIVLVIAVIAVASIKIKYLEQVRLTIISQLSRTEFKYENKDCTLNVLINSPTL